MQITTVSVVGLGKLGASMAAAVASRGLNVIGADVSARTVDLVNQGLPPIAETGLAAMMAANRERIRATLDVEQAVLDSDLTFVVVPTPTDPRGAFSVRYAAAAFENIGRALAHKPGYHNVVLTSTVLPGATRHALLPILESFSGKKAGADFGLCYGPEFIALGSVIRDFLNPDFVLLGEIDEQAGAQLKEFYAKVLLKPAPVMCMSIENAELAKIALNSYITTKISFANMLADICEGLPGGDVDVVTRAIGLDSRVGSKYLTGAVGFGGPCFPRDNAALAFIARELGATASIPESTNTANASRSEHIIAAMQPYMKPDARVAVLGLAYKAHTPVVEQAPGLDLAQRLADKGYSVSVYDPLAMAEAQKQLGDRVRYAQSIADCLEGADVVAITVPDPAYSTLEPSDFHGKNGRVAVVDCWRMLRSNLEGADTVKYVGIGLGQDGARAEGVLQRLWERAPSGAGS